MPISRLCLWLVITIVVASLVTTSYGSVVITTTASVGPPPISVYYGSYTDLVLLSLSTGSSQYPYPAPSPYLYSTAPNPLPWGAVAVDSSVQGLWLGEVFTDPASPLRNEHGTAYYTNVMIVGDGIHKISVADVSYQVTSSDPMHSLNATGTLADLTYGVDPIVGIDFGADGVRSLDDVYYNAWNPAPGSTKVDEILYAGVAVAWVGFDAVKLYVDSVAPVDVTIKFKANDGTGDYSSFQTRTVVPEPASLSVLAFGSLAFIRRRTKQ